MGIGGTVYLVASPMDFAILCFLSAVFAHKVCMHDAPGFDLKMSF
jgi:hypothetical protein